MSRTRLIKLLKDKNPSLNNFEINKVIDLFCKNIINALKEGKKVELRGFGTFFTKIIKEKHSARNPKTGELIYVPQKNKVRFKPSKIMSKKING